MEWIDFKIRRPEINENEKEETSESKPCICLMPDGEVYKMYYAHWYEDPFDEEHFYFYYSDSGEHCDYTPTHWMYFEEPAL